MIGPFNRSPTQSKVMMEKITLLENKIMSEAETLFNLQMDHRFQNVIPYFCEVRPSLDLMTLVSDYESRPTVYCTFICRRLNSFCLSYNNEYKNCLQTLTVLT